MTYCELFVLVLCIHFIPILTQECLTPNGFRAECKLLDDCAPLMSYMQRRPKNIMSQHEIHYINMLLCYTDEMDLQYVCCASDDGFYKRHPGNPTSTTRARTTTTTTRAPTTTTTRARTTTTTSTTTTTTTTIAPIISDKRFYDDSDFPDPSIFECGIDILKNRIVGGGETEIGEYPWMALLEYEHKISKIRSFSCGGSLIHRRFVLTAAHCVIGSIIQQKGALVNVRLGEHNTSATQDCQTIDNETECADAPLDVGVEYAQAHPRYILTTNKMANDIGIIRLARDIETTKYIQPICFPPSELDSPDGTKLTASGWGRTRSRVRSDVKLHVDVPIVNYAICQSTIHQIIIDNETQICAGGELGKDSCHGDSGGPLMRNKNGLWYLEGVVSFGVTVCGADGIPAIYTRVNAYRDWVLDFIQF